MRKDPVNRLIIITVVNLALICVTTYVNMINMLSPLTITMTLGVFTFIMITALYWPPPHPRTKVEHGTQHNTDHHHPNPKADAMPHLTDILSLLPTSAIIAGPTRSWTTFTHRKHIQIPEGTTTSILRDTSGQSYLELPPLIGQEHTFLKLQVPLSPSNLRQALTGRRSLKELTLAADWLFLTEEHPHTGSIRTILTKPESLNTHPQTSRLLPGDVLLSEPYETFHGWTLFTDDDLPSFPASADDQQKYLLDQLRFVFANNPIEPGTDHPADDIILRAIWTIGEDPVLSWLADACAAGDGKPFPAELLSCIKHLHQPGTPQWRTALISQALNSTNIELRDAAIQAAEHWQGPEVLAVLRGHQEPASFLREQIEVFFQENTPSYG